VFFLYQVGLTCVVNYSGLQAYNTQQQNMSSATKDPTGAKRKKNKKLSVSLLSRQDKIFFKALTVDTSLQSKHGNSKSVCWNYYRMLMYDHGDKKPCILTTGFIALCALLTFRNKRDSHIRQLQNVTLARYPTSRGYIYIYISNYSRMLAQ